MRLLAPGSALALAAAAALAGPSADTPQEWIDFCSQRAERLAAAGACADAIEEYRVLESLRPSDVEPCSRAAVVAVDADQQWGRDLTPNALFYSLAEFNVRAGVERGGAQNPCLAYAIGRLRYSDRKWGTSWRMLRQARDLGFDPLRASFWFYRAVVQRSVSLVEAYRAQEAVTEILEVLRMFPGHPDEITAKVNLAAGHRRMDEPDTAVKILDEVLRERPALAHAHYLLGMIYADQGRYDEAIAKFRDAVSKASSNYDDPVYGDALLREAGVWLRVQQLDKAEDAVHRYLELRKDDPSGLFTLGQVQAARGNGAEALKLFRRVARMRPDSTETLKNLLKVLNELGEREEADEVSRRLQEMTSRRDRDLDGDGSSPARPQAPAAGSQDGAPPEPPERR